MQLIQKQEIQAQEGEGITQESQPEAVGLGSEACSSSLVWEPLHYSARAFSLRECQSPQLYGTQNDTPQMDHKNLGADLRRLSKLSKTGRLVWKERNEGGKGGGRKKERNLSLHRPRSTLKCQGLIPEEKVWNGMLGKSWKYCFKQRTYLYTTSSVKLLLIHWHV